MIVSGHRRRKAVEILAQDDPNKWGEIPCIIETDHVSPALQQLRLIYANANTRTMTSAEVSEQAVQVERLLYQLKEEEGYEFPGRMRDHVAEAVGVSKSKLARLKVIRENLAKCFQPAYKKNALTESVAYALAQMPQEDQQIFFDVGKERGVNLKFLHAATVEKFKERIGSVDALQCKHGSGGANCLNAENKKKVAASLQSWASFHCKGCCKKCPDLISCKHSCPAAADIAAKLKADKREASKQAREAAAEKERPDVEQISAIWRRFGELRQEIGKSIGEIKQDLGCGFYGVSESDWSLYETGSKAIHANTKLPFGYNLYLGTVQHFISVADLFGVSLDYLLCRSDERDGSAPAQPAAQGCAWYPVSVEPPVGVELVVITACGYVDSGKYVGTGVFSGLIDDQDPVALWTPIPAKSTATAENTANFGWRSGTPEAYGTYAAYVQLDGSKRMLRELLWTGDEWLMFGNKISEDATVCCWSEVPME